MTIRTLFFLSLLLLPAAVFAQEEVSFETAPLTIETSSGERHDFTVEVAKTNAQRARGLMFRESLAEDAGMIFIYPRPKIISMWMRNTLIPLDMLFLDGEGTIVRIAERTTPLSEEIVASGALARYVIELKGGSAERLGLRPGDRAISEVLGD